jgi:hypothetical protein
LGNAHEWTVKAVTGLGVLIKVKESLGPNYTPGKFATAFKNAEDVRYVNFEMLLQDLKTQSHPCVLFQVVFLPKDGVLNGFRSRVDMTAEYIKSRLLLSILLSRCCDLCVT